MDHQTQINEQNGSPRSASKGLASDVGEFALNLLTLAELQGRLLVADVQECRQRILLPILLLLGGAALGLACFPLALTALALGIIQVFEISYAAGFLISVMVGGIVSALLCVAGALNVRKRAAVLRRSQQELKRNLRWIKNVIERNRTRR